MTEEIHQLQLQLQSDPNNLEAFKALQQHYAEQGQWRELVSLYTESAPELARTQQDQEVGFVALSRHLEGLNGALKEKRERGALLVALGDVYIEHLNRREDAMAAYQTSFKVWPKDTLCLERARNIYMAEGEYDRVMVLYELQSKVLRKMDRKPELARTYVEMAAVFGNGLQKAPRALEMLLDARRLDPQTEIDWELYERVRREPSVAERIEQMVEQSAGAAESNPREASRLMVRAARLERARAQGELEAAYLYAEQALSLQPDNEVASALLEQLLGELNQDQGLDPQAQQQAEEEARLMQELLREEQQRAEQGQAEQEELDSDSTHATMMLSPEQVAEIRAEGLAREDQAPPEQQHQAEAPQHEELSEEGEEEQSQEYILEEVSPEEREAGSEASDGAEGDVVMLAPVDVSESEQEEEEVVEGEERFEEDELGSEATEALHGAPESMTQGGGEGHHDDEEQDEELELGDEDLEQDEEPKTEEMPTDEARSDEQGERLKSGALRAERGVGEEAYQEALARHKKDAADVEALEAIKAELSSQGRFEELVALMERSVKYLRKKQGEFDQMLYLGRALWEELGDMDRAEYYFKRLRHHDATIPQVGEFYGEFFELKGQWRKLHVHLNAQLQQLDEEPARRALTERMAGVAEAHLGADKAIDAWRTFLSGSPGDPQAKRELRRLYEEHEKWQALVEYLRDEELELSQREGASSSSAGIAERVGLLEEIVAIYRDRVSGGDINRINALNQLLELEPSHRQGFEELKELLKRNRRFSDLAELLSEQADAAAERGDLERAVALLTEVADLWQHDLNNISKALPFLQRVVEVDPSAVDARERLKQAYTQRRDFGALFELMEQETERFIQADDPEAFEAHLRELLELAQKQLRDMDRAVPLLERLLEIAPQDLDLYQRLEFIYRRQEEWGQLVDLLEQKAHLDGLQDAEVIQIYKEAAQLSDARLEDDERAARLWQGVLSLDEGNATAFARLRDIYVQSRRFDELKGLFEARAMLDRYYDLLLDVAETKLEDLEERGEVYRRAARLAEHELLDATRVIRALEALLELSGPGAPEVARELIGWYRQTGELDREVAMQQLLLEHAEDDVARFVELVRLSELEIEREQDEEALKWLLSAIRAQPDERSAVERAEALARHVDLLEVYLDHLEAVSQELDEGGALQREFIARIARLSRDELEDNARAIELYERLRASEPEAIAWLEALEHLYDLAAYPDKRIEALFELVSRLEAQQGERGEEIVATLSKIAEVQHHHQHDDEAAQATYRAILERDEYYVPALRGLRKLYTERGEWDEVISALQREFELTPLDEQSARQAIRMELAHIWLDFKEQPSRALEAYRDVLLEEDTHGVALSQVEGLLGFDEVAREAALLIEPLLRARDEHERLARALKARLRVGQGELEEQEILEELVPLYEETLQDAARAFPHASRRFELDASNVARWEEVERLGGELDRWEEVEQLFVSKSPLSEQGEHEQRADLLARVAAIRERRLEDAPGALKAWERLRELTGPDLNVLEALERLYRQLGHHEQLVGVLEAKSEAVFDGPTRIGLLLEAANLTDELLDEVSGAIALYQRVLELDPLQREAVEALEALLRKEGRYLDLDELLANQAVLATELNARRNYQLQQAALRTNQLDDASGAFGILRELIAEQAEDPRPVFLLVNLDKVVRERDERAPIRLDIALELEQLYRARGEFDKVIEMIEVRLEFSQDVFERIALLDELAELYLERVGDQPGSFERLKQAVVLMPDELERRQRFERLGERLDKLGEVVEAYAEAAERIDDPFVAAPLYKRSGQILSDRLLRSSEAIKAYEKALKAQPEELETLKALERLYQQEQRFEPLADNLRAQSELVGGEERMALLMRIGDLEETVLERPTEAIDAWAELLNTDGDSPMALDALERLYERQEQWIDLGDVLRRKADLVADLPGRVALLGKLAQVQRDRLDDPTEAILTYQQILAQQPEHQGSLDALDALFVSQQRHADLADVLRSKLGLPQAAEQDELRVILQLRLAKTLREELMSLDEALDLYLEVFERYPGQDDARAALEELVRDVSYSERVAEPLIAFYRADGLFEELVALYDVLREQSHDDLERQAAHSHSQAVVLRDKLKQYEQAFEALARAWKLSPRRDDWRAELVALAEARETWSELAEVYEQVLLQVSEAERIKVLRVELAVIYRDRLEQATEAEIQLGEALNLDERDVDIFEALEVMYSEQRRWHDLIDLLERRYMVFIDQPEAKSLLLRIASIYDDFARDHVAAVEAYRRVLLELPTDEASEAAIKRLLREQQRGQDLADFLEDRIGVHAEDQEAVLELKTELAALYADQLNEPERALDLWTEILGDYPHHASTIASLEMLFERDETLRQPIAGLLEPLYLTREQWPRLIHMLRTKAEAEFDAHVRVELLGRIAQIAEERLRDYAQALTTYAEIFAIAPERAEVRQAMERNAQRLNAWPSVVDAYGATLEENYNVDDLLRAELLFELALIFEERLGDLERARATFARILEVDPINERAFDALERVHSRLNDFEALATVYRQRAEVQLDPAESILWLERLASLYEGLLNEPNEAIEVYTRISEIDLEHQDAQAMLELLYTQTGRFEDLADHYRRLMMSSSDPERAIRMQYKLAHLLDTQLDELDEALDLYRAVLTARPGYRDAMLALESMRRDLASREADFGFKREQIAELLLEHYEPERDWRRIVELLQVRQNLASSDTQRIDYLSRAAELIEEHTEDRTDLFQALSLRTDAWALQTQSAELFGALDLLATKLNAWERVIPQLLQGLERTEEVAPRSSLLNAAARIYQSKIDDPRSALIAYEQTFSLDPENETALKQLDALYSQFGHWESLGELLKVRLEHTYDGEAKINLLSRIASLYEETLKRPAEAIDAYEQLRQADPASRPYLNKLAVLYEQTEQDELLIKVLQSKAALIEDASERLGTLKKLAQIQHELVKDEVGAIDTYRQILAIHDGDALAVEALVGLYAERENWYELLEMLRLKRDFAEDFEALNRVDFRIAQIYLDHLEQPIDALESLAQITSRAPGWEPALEALQSMLELDGVREDVFTLLERLYRENARYELLAPLYERRLEYIEDAYLRAETLAALASVQEERLNDPTRALISYGRAFKEVPSQDEVRHALERIAQSQGAYDELIGVYEDALEAGVDDPIVRGVLHARLGELFVNERDEIKPAIAHLEAVLELDEYNLAALELLDNLYQVEQRWTDLADILERKISMAGPEQVAQARFRLGHLREREFVQPLDAFDLYRQVILEQPDHRGATEALERLIEHEPLRADVCDLLETAYTQTGAWNKLAQLLKFKLDFLVDAVHERADIMRRIGTLRLERLDDPAGAFQFFGLALSEDPFDLQAQEQLETITATYQYWPSLVELYDTIIPTCDDPLRQAELAFKAAEWSRTLIGEDLDRARRLYALVLEVEPMHEEALAALETIARGDRDVPELVGILNRKVKLLFDPMARFEAFAEMGELYDQLGARDLAIEALREASVIDGSDTGVLRRLIELYERQERWDDMVEELEHLANADPRPDAQLPVLARIGREASARLEDPIRALEAYERALFIAPQDVELLREIEPLYAQTSQFDRQGEILDQLLALATSDEDRVKVMVRRAQIAYEYHQDAEQAIGLFQQAYELSPSSEIITLALDDLYRKENRWEDLFNLYYGQLEQSQDVTRRAQLAVEMARIARDQVEDLATAVQWLDYALQLEPSHDEALTLKYEIYSGFGDWPQVTQILGTQFEYAETPEQRVGVLLRRAALYRDKLGQPQEAVDDFVEVLNQDPHHEQAYSDLTALLNQLQAWDQLYDVMAFRATIVEEDARRAMYLDMAEVARKLDDSARRIDALEKAYEMDPSDLSVVSPLLDATIAAGQYDRAEPMLEQVIEALTEKRRMKEVVQFYHLRGKLAEQRGQIDEALEIYESARKIDATYVPNLLSLGKLLYAQQEWDSALKILQTLLLHQMSIKDPQDKLDMYYYLGQVRLQTGDARRAKDMFNRALGVDPTHQPSREAIEQL